MPSSEPKFAVYAEALCIGDRDELAPIFGKRVGIIDRFVRDDGTWAYRVFETKASPVIICEEGELEYVDPIPYVTDEENMENIVAQTADLRYSVRHKGLRAILSADGFDPMRCLQITCDQGDDVHVTLVLPDGTIIGADYKEHPETRQAFRFSQWEVLTYCDREVELCREITSADDSSEFDSRVKEYYEDQLSRTDRGLSC